MAPLSLSGSRAFSLALIALVAVAAAMAQGQAAPVVPTQSQNPGAVEQIEDASGAEAQPVSPPIDRPSAWLSNADLGE